MLSATGEPESITWRTNKVCELTIQMEPTGNRTLGTAEACMVQAGSAVLNHGAEDKENVEELEDCTE